MKVKFLRRMTYPYGTYEAGEIVDLPEDEARELIGDGAAKAVKEPSRTRATSTARLRRK